MIYLSITQIDAVTGIICTAEPMRTGPAYPQIKNCNIYWCNKSTWPIATTAEGAHTVAPLFFGTCDDDADLITLSAIICGNQLSLSLPLRRLATLTSKEDVV